MNTKLARYAAFTVLLMTLFTLAACIDNRSNNQKELDALKDVDPTGKSKSIDIKDAYIAGELGEYIAIEDGEYDFGVSNDGNYNVGIAVNIRLLKEYPGDPQEAADTFSLIPLAQGSLQIEEIDRLIPDTRGKTRFVSLLSGTAGSSASIPFSGQMWGLSNGAPYYVEIAAKVFDAVAGFEGDTFTRYVFAVAPVSSERREEDTAEYRGWIQQGLMEHRLAYRFRLVDTSQIDKITAQHRFELSDWSNPNKAAEIGKALNANVLVTSTESPSSHGSISVTVLDINTMEVLGAAETNYFDDHAPIERMELKLR